jgi:ribosomal protein L32
MAREHFLRCRTCGRYLRADRVVGDRFCSEQCALQYARCPNCGKYFRAGTGYGKGYCSQACSVQYRLERAGESKHSLSEELS